jgi:6-phosphogluconate dehydrogenase
MRMAMIGLGRMGMNMGRRLLRDGHRVTAYNRSPEKTQELVREGASGAYSLPEVVEQLDPPRIVWIMLPAGQVVDEHVIQLRDLLSPGDLLVDGGNSFYKDDLRRADLLAPYKIQYLDVGVSGGIWGLELGYCLMVGGPRQAYDYMEPVLTSLSSTTGHLYCGGAGAGHFVKMVHNGIEYGLMQAYGEGFQLLAASPYADAFDYAKIAHLWNQGSVIRSWLLELAESAFTKDPDLSEIRAYVPDSGEGRWTVQQAVESGVSAPLIALALMQRFRSQDPNPFTDRLVAALRREFGGHSVARVEK